MQRHISVVVQFADRNAEPIGISLADHGVVLEHRELTRPHPGPGQQLDHQPPPSIGVLGQSGHEDGSRRIVKELR